MLPPGVNFTNTLRAAFSYESFLRRFYVLTIWVCIFWQMDFGAKAAHKMLVKLPPGDRNWQLIYPNCFILFKKIAISLYKFEYVSHSGMLTGN